MKKYILSISAVFILIVSCFLLCVQPKVKFKDASYGTAKFTYNDVSVETKLSDEDLKQAVSIFTNKGLTADSPSCSFTENVSIKIDGQTFCVACDMCGIVYLLEADRYFHLSDDENETMRTMLMGYGFEFPCI